MSTIRHYFQPKDGLPDPRGSLQRTMPSKAIALANAEVEKATNHRVARGPYNRSEFVSTSK